MIMAIALKAGRSLAIDDFTVHTKETSYARVRVEIDAGIPLMPGDLI